MDSVYFRTFEENDWETIYEWKNDDQLTKLSVGLNRRVSKEECRKWVAARINHSPYEVWWAICAKDTDMLIGYMYLSNIHYINRSAEFGGLVIGNRDYQDGLAWIESYLFVLEYSFERLNLNRLYGYYISEHSQTRLMSEATYFRIEGIRKEALYKNGRYHDQIDIAILANEYYTHLKEDEYKETSIIRRLIKLKKESKRNSDQNI